ncbi:MAG: phage scaffolding protein [Schleiferilactobacillus perolens]|uniref:phage scaffolding protein n=1 Tax=Schleiferilactobacillus perolens TaxID=100468 RepID=UPI0039ED0706
MERKDLKALDLTDEQVDKIMALHGQDINTLKGQVESLTTEKQTMSDQISQSSKQLEQLKADNKDNKELQEQLKSLEEANKQAKTEAAETISQANKNFNVELALRDAHVRDSKAVMPYLNQDDIKFADGKLSGLDDQIKTLKADHDWLFEPDKPAATPKQVSGGNPPVNQQQNSLQDTLREGLKL